jgi:hypothetical protein
MPEPFDWTRCPEAAGPLTEPRAAGGPALDVQAIAQHSVRLPQLDPSAAPGEYVPVSRAEPLLDPATRDRERDECERRNLLRQQVQDAALAAAKNAMVAQTLSAQVFEDVSAAVERAVTSAPAPAEPAVTAKEKKP